MKMNKKTITKKRTQAREDLYYILALVGTFLSSFIFFSCEDNNEHANLLLNENEIFFNEKLISITQNGSDYYIGTESSGRIYVYSSEKNTVIDTLDTDCGRIYQVKQTKDVDTFYVGTQNMGLKKMHRNDRRLEEKATFIIKGKENRYSCYDVFIENDAIYAMTSHGIYQIVQSDTLKPIYAFFVDGNPDPFVASNMVKGGSYYFGATTKGLVRITPIINDTTTILPQKKIRNVVCYNDTIYALSDSLYRIEPNNRKVIDTFGLKAPAKIYYRADGINYFLSDNYLTLAHDTTLLGSQPELHKKVVTRRQLSVDGHNNMIADSKDYSLLVTDHALWQVGHHLPSVFGELKEGGVKLACIYKSSIYFLVGKKVYKLDSGIVAKEVLELNEEGDINLMECSLDGDSLYYVNRDNVVYRQNINTPWYKFWPDLADSIGKPEKEITAMCIHNSVPGAILALRDSLIYMAPNSTNAIKLITHDKNEVSFPYIRRFTVGDSIFAPTMNDGLFSGKGKELHRVKGTENLQFIRDVACSDSSNSLYILTNRHLILGKDSVIDNSNFGSRLLISGNMIYIPGEVGGVRVIQLGKNNKIVTDSIRFPDVSFRAESSWVLDSIVYLGGQSGVIALNSKNGISKYVQFDDSSPFPYLLLSLLLSIVVIVIFFFLLLREKFITIHWKRFHKESISSKIERLKEDNVYNLLDDSLQSRIDKLDDLLEGLQNSDRTGKKEKRKEINTLVDNLTIEVTLILKDILSSVKAKYEILAYNNESPQFERKYTEGSDNLKQLASLIGEYNEAIRIEEDIADYKLIFEKKLNLVTSVEYKPLPNELRQINAIRSILEKEDYDSKNRLNDMNLILLKGKCDILPRIESHIEERIEVMKKLRNNDNYRDIDNDIITQIEDTFRLIKDKVHSRPDIVIKELFDLIKETTLNDGKLEMVTQLMNIRDIVKVEKLDEEDKKDLEKNIKEFFIPTLAFQIDMDVYKHLIENTTNDKGNPPKGIEGNNASIQPSFFILAIAMAKGVMPEKCKNYFYKDKNTASISRGKGFAAKWINCPYIKGLRKNNENVERPRCLSVSAYYLKKVVVPSKQKQ